jgi:hypothetical protein
MPTNLMKSLLFAVLLSLSLGCAGVACKNDPGQPDDPGAALALGTADSVQGRQATRSGRLDIGDWTGYAVRPDPIPADYDDASYALVNLETEEVVRGEDAMRLVLELTSDPRKIAVHSLAFLRRGGAPLSGEEGNRTEREKQYVQPPAIEGTTLEYWYYKGSPSRTLFRDRLDMETLEIETSSVSQVHQAAEAADRDDDADQDDDADDPGARLAYEFLGKPNGWDAVPMRSLDVGDWKGYVLRPKVRIHGDPGKRTCLVRLDDEKVVHKAEAMKVVIEHVDDPKRLARLSLLVQRGGGNLLTGPDPTVNDRQREQIQPPSIDGSTLEYWYFKGSPARFLYRDRLDLDTLELETVRSDRIEDGE